MKLKKYLYTQFSNTFFPIFFGLYFITSIVFLVKIAALTSVITIDFYELSILYMYVVPSILFYTLPVTFFISMAITFSKLSSEYELIVITSFGLNPTKILKIFFPMTFLISLSLLIISLGLMPKANYENQNFIEKKKAEANFNIKASEFGQNFGSWLIFIDRKDDKDYHDVKLLKVEDKQDQFVIAKKAVMDNNNGDLSFKLTDGKSFSIKENELNQIDYTNMILYNRVKNSDVWFDFTTAYEYWMFYLTETTMYVDKFTFNILLSIFPLVSIFLTAAFGYYNPRYEKSKTIPWSVFFIVIYYTTINFLSKSIYYHALYIVPFVWLILTYFLYKHFVKKQY
ncbi:LptF/LptG family permease [Halarcobacter ebronensis]|uniref:Permease n=1 Tax=Halarcobacter ebronensis TaxID=1462615 RepID=A0A4Q1AL64_9BACT|nr:LptF/LptG family permease [Halarcobacter ebronensis]QKF83288.1 lipooligosaccharide transport system, ABC transporter permease component LptF [Halarcobacter ebronensis]RXK05851.1 permease [Halarcobacter ebronensis]